MSSIIPLRWAMGMTGYTGTPVTKTGVHYVWSFTNIRKSMWQWVFQNQRISTYEKSVRLYMVLECSGDDILL